MRGWRGIQIERGRKGMELGGIKNNPYEKEKNISLINKKIKQDKNIFP